MPEPSGFSLRPHTLPAQRSSGEGWSERRERDIYIYIQRERERKKERQVYVYVCLSISIYIYIYIYIYYAYTYLCTDKVNFRHAHAWMDADWYCHDAHR